MSSAITEYIHFYQKNYNEWGINRVGTIKSDSLVASFNQVRNQIRDISELKSLLIEAKQIEEDYNDLFFPKTSTEFSQLLAELAQETLQEQFGQRAGKINNSNFNVQQSGNIMEEYRKKIIEVQKKIKLQTLKQNASTAQMLNRIEKLNDILLNFENDTKLNTSFIKNKIINAKSELKNIKEHLLQNTDSNIKNKISIDIQTINKLIQQFNRSFTWYNQRGDLFEWLLPLIQFKSTKLTGEKLKSAMKSVIGTGNLGSGTTSISFPDFLNMTNEQLSKSIESEKLKMQIIDVRNKTDVIIQYAIGNGKYKNLAVSAKSITNPHIKLVEATSLYRILIFSQNYDFIKHYLNIISYSTKGGKASEDEIVKANRLTKGLVMQLATQGFDLNNPSELLIVHDVKKRKINVYNIKALIYLIKKEIIEGEKNKYSKLIKMNDNNFNDNFTIKQQFQSTVEQRLKKLLFEINSKKITAHIYGTQLKDYLKFLGENNII